MKRAIIYFIVLFVNISLFAQNEYETQDVHLLGRYPEGANLAVTAMPGYVFSGKGAVLEVFSQSADTLEKLSDVTLHGPITSLFVSAERHQIFATTENFGLEIVDIQNPENPEILGFIHLDETVTAVYVYENYAEGPRAFVLGANGFVYAIDVNDPDSPQLLSSLEIGGDGKDLYGDGGNLKLYAALGTNGFAVVDISNPNLMQILAEHDAGYAWGIYKYDNNVYIADYYGKLRVYSVSGSNISFLYYFSTTGSAYDVVVSDTTAYVALGNNGIVFFDLTENAYPAYFTLAGTAMNVFYCGINDKVFVSAYEAGLYEIDASTPNITYSSKASGNTIGLWLDGNTLHTAQGFDGYKMLDVAEPQAINVLGKFSAENSYSKGVAKKDEFIYLAAGETGVIVLSTENKDSVTAIDTIEFQTGSPSKIFIDGNYAYVAARSGGVKILDITEPGAPEFVAGFNTAYSAEDVWVENGYAYVADYLDGLEIWNVSDISNIQGVATTNQPVNGVKVFKRGSVVFLAGKTSGVRVIDCSDFDDVHELAYIRPSDYSVTYSVYVDSLYIYTADGPEGIHVIDYHSFDSLNVVGYFQTGGRARDILVRNTNEGNNIYVADENDGIYVLRYVKPDAVDEENYSVNNFELLQNYPNPFNPSTNITYIIARSGATRQSIAIPVQLKIYDALGREVATLVNAKQAPGKYSVQFNASKLSSGIYFYTLSADNFVQTRKMILMK